MTLEHALEIILKVCWIGLLVVLFFGLLGVITLHPL